MKIEVTINIRNPGMERVLELLESLIKKEDQEMALGQDILDAVTAEDTKVDSVIALIQSLKDNGTIPPDVATAILAKIKGSEDKLDAVIGANTAPPISPTP